MTSDTSTLSGDRENRVSQLLQARPAPRQGRSGDGPPHAGTEQEDALPDQIAALDRAAEDDKADAEATGEGRTRASGLAPTEGRLIAPRSIWRGR